MIDRDELRPPGRRRAEVGWTRSQRVRAVLSLGVVLGLGAVSTQAAWTDTSTATSGTFTTGTLDIKLGNPAVDNNPTEFATSLAMTNMAPGSTTDAPLRVTNGGSLPLTFSANGGVLEGPELAGALRLTVFPAVLNGTCSGTAIVSGVAAVGSLLPAQPVLAAGATRDLCIRVSLPTDAPTTLQGESTKLVLTFTAANA